MKLQSVKNESQLALAGVKFDVQWVDNSIAQVTATDADGASISTPNDVIAKIAADSLVSTLLSATATGTGAGLVGTLGTFTALPMSFVTGDVFTAETTPPSWLTTDLQEVYASLLKNQTALTLFGFLHVNEVNNNNPTKITQT